MGVYLYFYISDSWDIQFSEKKEDAPIGRKSWLLRRPFPKYMLWEVAMETAYVGVSDNSIRTFFSTFKLSLKDLPDILDQIPPSEKRMEGLCRIIEAFGESVDSVLNPNLASDSELLNIPDGGDVWQDQGLC